MYSCIEVQSTVGCGAFERRDQLEMRNTCLHFGAHSIPEGITSWKTWNNANVAVAITAHSLNPTQYDEDGVDYDNEDVKKYISATTPNIEHAIRQHTHVM